MDTIINMRAMPLTASLPNRMFPCLCSEVAKPSSGSPAKVIGSSLYDIGRSLFLASDKKLRYGCICQYKGNQCRTMRSKSTFLKGKSQASTARDNLSANQMQWNQTKEISSTSFCTRESVYVFHTDTGGEVKAFVRRVDTIYKLTVAVSPYAQRDQMERDLKLHWGIFRSDSLQWVTLDSDSIPDGTIASSTPLKQNFMETPFQKFHEGSYSVELSLESIQSPFYVGFVLKSSSDEFIRTHLGRDFCVPVGFGRGRPDPLGFSLGKDGHVNFAVYARAAEKVILCLYDDTSLEPCLQIELDSYMHRTGFVWHVSFDNLGPYTRYGYQCKGDINWETGNRFHPRLVLLDPYSRILASFIPGQDVAKSPACCLGSLLEEPPFDWGNDVHPRLALEDLIVYRLKVDSFTSDKSSGLESHRRGTFLGLVDKIQHFKKLGVNAILLEPVFAFDRHQSAYTPYSFFAPMDYGEIKNDGISASISFKEMVKECHTKGIEVILEVVYTQTAEKNDADPKTMSFRGIDNATYYILDENNEAAGDEAPNLFNCNHPVVQKLIIDSLRHWITEYHVDGFVFSNSSALMRGCRGNVLSRPPLIEAVAFDPLLSKSKIIADPCLPILGECNECQFPHWKRWAGFNVKYRDDIRKFLRGDKGQLSNFATRLCGSGDNFTDGRGPSFSLNFVTQNFGSSLVDLVSFSNFNGSTESSWNCGDEGATKKQSVLETRLKQIRNFLFILFVSLGVPVLNMGDECGQSTGGSTLYSDRKPFDWRALATEFSDQTVQFIAFLSEFRASRKQFFQRKSFAEIEHLKWHGIVPEQPQWDDPNSSYLAVTLKSERGSTESDSSFGDIYMAFNAGKTPQAAYLPQLPVGYSWCRVVDTSLPFPDTISMENNIDKNQLRSSGYEVQSHSCILFEACLTKNEVKSTFIQNNTNALQ